MNRRKYRVLAIMLLGVLLGGAGCAGRESLVLDPKSPTVITMWHAYNAVAKAQFDDLVMEFNETVGMEQGDVYKRQSVSKGNMLVCQTAGGIP